MITDCPDPQEVADFHFRQLRTLKITENERAPVQSVNLLASGSKHGLLFVGVEGGFKVIKLEDILTLDEDKENRGRADAYPCSFVPCGTPLVLSVNADQTRLAVCVKDQSGIVIRLYALASLSAPPRVSRLSSADVGVSDFSWNPTIGGLFACCLGDGSLHICQDEEGTAQVKTLATLPPSANALSVCWSPKGKQLVCGKVDGSFTQYKQTLQEVKTIPPPPPQELDSPAVRSMCWIANTVFAVVYAASDGPSLFLVSTPKDSPVVYTNFGDICLGNNSDSKQKYFFHLEPLWGVFICASIDSIEIAVLGNMPQWVQWDLREDGKALLPGKDGATHAVGLAVMYSAQGQIQISESEVYPPMPVMFVLTDNGLLISYHMINAREGAPSLVSPPLPLQSGGLLPSDDSQMSGKAPTSEKPPATGQSSAVQSTPSQSYVSCTNYSAASFTESLSGRLNKQPPTSDTAYLPHPEALTESLSSMETSYRLAILSEIQSFEKELQALKQLQNFDCDVDKGEDMVSLKIGALNLQNFQKNIFETMRSLSGDVYSLKNALLECFVMAEEGSSRERRRNDHSYVTILKERSLDPLTCRRMQGIHRHHQYLAVQLQEVNNRLDEEWTAAILNTTRQQQSIGNTLCISSTEAVYKTIVNNQKIIHSLKKKVDTLLEKNKEKKLRNTTKSGTWRKYERSTYEDLSKLADEFLNVRVSVHQGEKEEPTASGSRKLCPESQNSLRAFLKESHILTVRPTAVYSSSQSRLLSSTLPSQDPKKQEVTVSKNTAPPVADRDPKEDILQEGVQQKYAPICEPVTPPDDKQSPRTNLFGGTSNETCLGSPFASMPPVSINSKKSSTTQEFNFGIASSSSDREVHRAPLFPPETNVPEAPKTKAQSSSSFFSPLGAISSTHVATKSQECTITSASAKSGTLFSLNPSAKKDTMLPSATTAFVADASRSFQQGLPSTIAASISFTTASSFPPPAVLTPQTSNSLFNVTTSKNSASESFFGKGVDFFGTGSSEPFSFLTTTFGGTTERATISEKDQIPPATESSSLVDLLNANVCNPNSRSQQECKTDESKSPLSKAGDSVPPLNSPQCSSALVVTSNQPSINSTSESKEVAPALNKFLSDPVSVENAASEDNTVIVVSSPKTSHDVVAHSAFSQNMTPAVTLDSIPPTLAVSSIISSTAASSMTSVITVSSMPSTTVAVSSVPSLVTVSPVASTAVATNEDASAMPALNAPSDQIKPSISVMPALSPVSSVTLAGEKVAICSPVTSDSVKNAGASTGFAAPSSLFGKTSSGTSFFQSTATTTAAPAFGQVVSQSSSSFGKPSTFSSPSTFFTQPPSFEAAPTTSAQPASSSDLDTQLSAFSFGKTATTTFGQTTGGFGLSKSLFGQNEAPPNQSSALTSFSFAQNPAFGQGSFFGGLGGKPSEENASKNVFGAKSTAADTAPTSNLFGNTGVTSFGTVNSGDSSSFGGGSFIAGGGSVAQSGFGAFQKSPQQQQQQTGGFGTAPAFGGAPAFGSAPAFGASPSFGSGSPLASVFGQQQQVSSNFSSFANASSPTFGSLASQGSTFGSPTGGGGGTTFGSPGFGSFASPTSSFGNPGSPASSGSSAFTQWRN